MSKKYNSTQNKPSIVHVLQQEGVELKKYGSRYKAKCPLHQEKSASFVVYPETESFFCHGCQQGGDVIALIIKLKNMSFIDAITYLGISGNSCSPVKRDSKMLLKRRLVKAFRNWEIREYDRIAFIYRTFYKIKSNIKTMQQAEKYADVYHMMSICEYRMDILSYGDDEAKYELFLEVESV